MEILRFLLLGVMLLLFSCSKGDNTKIIFPENLLIDTIPFVSEPTAKAILVEVMVQGKSYKFVFDSGSENTLINSSIPSEKITSETVFFKDILDQLHSSSVVLLDTLQLGSLMVIQMDSYLQRNLNLDGILGVDILEELVWKIDLFNRNIYVTKDVNNFHLSGKNISFKKKGKRIYLEGSINGIKLEFLVDTGHNGFISINKELIDRIPTGGNPPVFWEDISSLHSGNPFASESFLPWMDTTYYMAGDINIDGLLLKNEVIKLHNKPRNYIGMDFLKRFDYFIFDYPNQRIYFGNEQKKSLDFLTTSLFRLNSKGVILVPSGSILQIKALASWVRNSGINYLDTVVSIDHISIMNRDSSFYQNKSKMHTEINYFEHSPSKFQQLWNDFHFISDTSVLGLKRGDSSQNFTLIRQYNFRDMPDSLQDYYIDLSLPLPTINRVKTESASYYTFKTNELLPPGLRKE